MCRIEIVEPRESQPLHIARVDLPQGTEVLLAVGSARPHPVAGFGVRCDQPCRIHRRGLRGRRYDRCGERRGRRLLATRARQAQRRGGNDPAIHAHALDQDANGLGFGIHLYRHPAVLAPHTRLLVAAERHVRVHEIVASAAWPISRPVAGSNTLMVLPERASTHSPLMNNRGFKARNLFTAADGLGCAAMLFALAMRFAFTGGSRGLIADVGAI